MTAWGPLAEDFLTSPACDLIDFFGFSEHHLPKDKRKKFSDLCKQTHRRDFFVPAIPKNSGTSGGVFLAPTVDLALLPTSHSEMFHAGSDWVAMTLRLRGLDILLIQVYLISGMGPKKDNLVRIGEIFAYALSTKLYYIVFGDFNMTPGELVSTGIPHRSHASVVTVDAGSPTCRTGRCLDFIVASADIVPSISGARFVAAPWKMHDTIAFNILRAPRQVMARFLVRPARFQDSMKTIEQDSRSAYVQPLEGDGDFGEIKIDWKTTALSSVVEGATATGARYASWSSAAESRICLDLGLEGNRFLGRGKAPRYVVRAIAKPVGAPDRQGCGHTVWATIESHLLVVLQHRKHGKINQRYQLALEYFYSTACMYLYDEYVTADSHASIDTFHKFLWYHRIKYIEMQPNDIIAGMHIQAIV